MLKKLLTSAPILKIENMENDFVVCTNACKHTIIGVITKYNDVVCYESIKLNEHEKN